MGLGELRRDVADVVGHAAQDGVHDRFGRITPAGPVPVDLLDPLKVDHRHDSDLEIGEPGEIRRLGHRAAVQPLVEQQIAGFEIAPWAERAGGLAEGRRLVVVM